MAALAFVVSVNADDGVDPRRPKIAPFGVVVCFLLWSLDTAFSLCGLSSADPALASWPLLSRRSHLVMHEGADKGKTTGPTKRIRPLFIKTTAREQGNVFLSVA